MYHTPQSACLPTEMLPLDDMVVSLIAAVPVQSGVTLQLYLVALRQVRLPSSPCLLHMMKPETLDQVTHLLRVAITEWHRKQSCIYMYYMCVGCSVDCMQAAISFCVAPVSLMVILCLLFKAIITLLPVRRAVPVTLCSAVHPPSRLPAEKED